MDATTPNGFDLSKTAVTSIFERLTEGTTTTSKTVEKTLEAFDAKVGAFDLRFFPIEYGVGNATIYLSREGRSGGVLVESDVGDYDLDDDRFSLVVVYVYEDEPAPGAKASSFVFDSEDAAFAFLSALVKAL